MPDKNDSTRPVNWEDLDKYLAGEFDHIDMQEIEHLLATVPDATLVLKSQGLFEDAVSHDPTLSARSHHISVAQSWDALAAKLTSRTQDRPDDAWSVGRTDSAVRSTHGAVGDNRASRLRFAVQVLSAAVLAVAAWLGGVGKVRNDLSTYASVYSTQPGRQATVTLPDGTHVLLNVGSSLEVGGNFLTSNRKVKLTGQARFNVTHRTGKPFSVETSTGMVTVLGTEFVVRDYKWDSVTTISVWEGKVGLGENVISAGEQVSVRSHVDNRSEISKSPLDTASNSFADGVLIVKDRRLKDILPELSNWYAIDIRFGDSVTPNRRISGRFELGSVSELVEVLAWTLDIRSERNGDQITLYSK